MKAKISKSKSSACNISSFKKILCTLLCTKDRLWLRLRELNRVLDIPEDEVKLLLGETVEKRSWVRMNITTTE